MWIKMLNDQVGPNGIYLKGQTISLPLKMVEKLDSASYVQVDVDDQAMEQMGVEERLRHLGAELATIDAAVKSAKDRLADLHKRQKVLRTKTKQADDELEEIKQARTKAEMEQKDGKSGTEGPADQPIEQPIDQTVEQPIDQPVEQPVDESGVKQSDGVTGGQTDEAGKAGQ